MGAGVLVDAEGSVAGDHRRLRDGRHPAEAEGGRDRPLVHDAVAGELRVLLVEEDVAADQVLVLERPSHHPRRADRQPVVGEPDRAGLAHRGHLGQLAPFHPAGDRADEADRDGRDVGGLLAQGAHLVGLVDDRIGVRHRDHPAVAARRGGAGAGLDVLLVLLAGAAQVDVGVEEGGEGVQAARVDLLGALRRLRRPGLGDLGDPAVADDEVAEAVEPRARVDDVGAADQQRPRRRRRASPAR